MLWSVFRGAAQQQHAYALRGQGEGKSQLKVTLNSDGLASKIVKKGIVCEADAEIFDTSPGAVPQNMQTDDCVGDALRRQGRAPAKVYLELRPLGEQDRKLGHRVRGRGGELRCLARYRAAAGGGRALPRRSA